MTKEKMVELVCVPVVGDILAVHGPSASVRDEGGRLRHGEAVKEKEETSRQDNMVGVVTLARVSVSLLYAPAPKALSYKVLDKTGLVCL